MPPSYAPWLTRRRFHMIRAGLWAVQIPLAITTSLKTSITYLVFLSLAALVESSATDWDQSRQQEREQDADA